MFFFFRKRSRHSVEAKTNFRRFCNQLEVWHFKRIKFSSLSPLLSAECGDKFADKKSACREQEEIKNLI